MIRDVSFFIPRRECENQEESAHFTSHGDVVLH
jgi:hypothetical protein